MPKRRQLHTGGLIFHVMNRAVRRAPLFTTTRDYETFFDCLLQVPAWLKMRVLAIALMSNHWHMVLWPRRDGDLSDFVGRITLTHACRWQRVHETRGTGPVYQGRFKAIPVQPGQHLVTVIRYVERNPVKAGLVKTAEEWPWSSASTLAASLLPPLAKWPIPRPSNWLQLVNEPDTDAALSTLRESLVHGLPYGETAWSEEAMAQLGWKDRRAVSPSLPGSPAPSGSREASGFFVHRRLHFGFSDNPRSPA